MPRDELSAFNFPGSVLGISTPVFPLVVVAVCFWSHGMALALPKLLETAPIQVVKAVRVSLAINL
jgi:hypothetical protein